MKKRIVDSIQLEDQGCHLPAVSSYPPKSNTCLRFSLKMPVFSCSLTGSPLIKSASIHLGGYHYMSFSSCVKGPGSAVLSGE